MVGKWQQVQLGRVCLKVGSGATPRGGKEAYLGGNTALIRSQNIYNDRFTHEGLVYIDDLQAYELRSVAVEEHDVLLNITGDSVARCTQVDPKVLPARVNQHVAIIRPQPDLLDARFLRYVLVSSAMQDHLLTLASAGATRNALTKAMIESLTIQAPPITEQRAIAHILGTLDDKVEVNRRANETLEEMARALFKAWFVNFEPVRAKLDGRWQRGHSLPGLPAHLYDLFPDRLVEVEGGEIPEGWARETVGDILELAYGKALKASDRIEGPHPVYGSGGVTGYHARWLVQGPTVIVGRKGSVGTLYWEDRSCYPIDTVFYVLPNLPLTYCFYCLESLGLEDMNTDAAVPGLNRGNVYRLHVSTAPDKVIQEFDKIVLSFRNRIRSAMDEINSLSAIRDALLPKLISGELRVTDAERFLERV